MKPKPCYWVDLPNPECKDDRDNNTWVNIATLPTKKEAKKLLTDRYGISPRFHNLFITAGHM
jgi:hypothetical protein